jgi:hypothetical protein
MRKLMTLLVLAALAPTFPLAEERATTKDAERMVHKAVEFLKKKDKAFAVFSDPNGSFTYRDIYIYVLSLDGVVLAHPTKSELIGKNNMKAREPDGKYYTKEAMDVARAKGSGWIEYKFENPATHKLEIKVASVERVDDVVVGCGAFKPWATAAPPSRAGASTGLVTHRGTHAMVAACRRRTSSRSWWPSSASRWRRTRRRPWWRRRSATTGWTGAT